MSVNTVVIAGFTGKVARLITSHILKNHPQIKIHGIARSPEKIDAATRQSPNVTIFKALPSEVTELRHALKGASVCICCYLGDYELMNAGQKTLIDACIEEGVPRYIASDWSLDYRGLEFGQHPNKDPMKHIQAYLEEKAKQEKIQGVHVLNGGFMEIILGPFAHSLDAKKNTYRYWGTGDEPIDMTTYADAAAFTAEVAADPKAVGFLNVVGDRVSAKQLAKAYEKVYGESLKLENNGSLEDLKKTMLAALEQHPHEPRRWMGMCYGYYMLNGATTLGPEDTARYPIVQPQSVEDFFRKHTRESLSKLGT